jgi:hypothetical protein
MEHYYLIKKHRLSLSLCAKCLADSHDCVSPPNQMIILLNCSICGNSCTLDKINDGTVKLRDSTSIETQSITIASLTTEESLDGLCNSDFVPNYIKNQWQKMKTVTVPWLKLLLGTNVNDLLHGSYSSIQNTMKQK